MPENENATAVLDQPKFPGGPGNPDDGSKNPDDAPLDRVVVHALDAVEMVKKISVDVRKDYVNMAHEKLQELHSIPLESEAYKLLIRACKSALAILYEQQPAATDYKEIFDSHRSLFIEQWKQTLQRKRRN